MKNLLIIIICVNAIVACSPVNKLTPVKPPYEVVKDDETKVLKGTIDCAIIANDTAFKWFAENMKYGQADATAVQAFKTNAANFDIIVFGGTWCHDTQNLLPVFYRLVDKSGYPDNKITLIGVDRAKTAPGDIQKTYNVTMVPTFIIMKDGKEVGRVVEYGTMGQIDKELGEIVVKAFSK